MQMCFEGDTEREQVSAGSAFPLLTESKNELIWREKNEANLPKPGEL